MLEQQLQSNIIKYLKAQGYYVVKVIESSKRGTPDVLACSPTGGFVAIEVKAPGKLKGVTPLQYFHLAEVTKRGGVAFAADSLDTVKEIIFSPQTELEL